MEGLPKGYCVCQKWYINGQGVLFNYFHDYISIKTLSIGHNAQSLFPQINIFIHLLSTLTVFILKITAAITKVT